METARSIPVQGRGRGSRWIVWLWLVAAAIPLPQAQSQSANDAPGFVDVTEEAGITYVHDSSPPLLYPPQIMGPGCAVGDYDRDGWMDIFLPGSIALPTRPLSGDRLQHRGRLFRNRGNGTFEDVTEQAFADHTADGLGASWADADGDGHIDLYLTGFGHCALLKNCGDGAFRDVTRTSGLSFADRFAAHSTWADYDRDGRLDLYVTAYIEFSYPDRDSQPEITVWHGHEVPVPLAPPLYDGQGNALFHNEGGGRFLDMTAQAGVDDNEDLLSKSLGAAWLDLDDDGWLDLVVANDGVRKTLFMNRGDGTFRSAARSAWLVDRFGSMGICTGDVDGDGRMDLHFSNWLDEPDTLYLNRRGTALAESAETAHLADPTRPLVGWGTEFLDYDLDGNLDLVVACGSTFASEYRWKTYLQDPNLMAPMPASLFQGDGRGRFTDVSEREGLDRIRTVGRGLATGDFNRDGSPDLLIGVNNGRAVLLENRTPGRGHWVTIGLVGQGENRDGIGARLTLRVKDQMQTRLIQAGSGYLSSSSPVAHFGLGPSDRVDQLEIRWPDGKISTHDNIPLNRHTRIKEP